ncbi:MAG: type IV secretory system conjugative DNA transfer family protein [Lachnospiraceae bacterium]|nr:type IV secretory system conjugative DNA transfer family protein [Lachnospiraceae bacterium]
MSMDKVILGENVFFSSDCDETGINNNIIVCGGSGSGKTMSISEARLLETFNSSLIVTATKRRIVNKYKEVFKKRGYKVYDLNFTNPSESDISFDPMYYIDDNKDIRFLAESIVMSDARKEKTTADPFWDEAAISLLSAEIALIRMSDSRASFADVLRLHDKLEIWEYGSNISSSFDDRFNNLSHKHPGCFAVSCWKTFSSLPMRTAGCVYGALNATIDTIFSSDVRKMIAMNKKVDFEELANEKTVLFVSTSAVNPAINCFVNLFYSQVFKSLFEYAESLPGAILPRPVHILCDDFATGSKILNFPEYISVFREKQISVTLLLQSESQLEHIYGSEDATTIINNCDTYLFMGGMDLKTGRSVSERLNAPLEDVLYMPIGQEVIFRRGQRPIITQRYDIKKNSMFQKITKEFEMAGR